MEMIDNTKKYFESQLPDEKVILLIRRHFLAILPHVVMASLVYFVGLLLVFVMPVFVPFVTTGPAFNIYILLVSLMFFFNTAYLFHSWVLHYLHVGILTDDHLVEVNQSGLFARKVSQMSLDKIQDVSASQRGMVNTMFNLGTVDIQTAGEAPNFILEFIPDPNAISQKIMQIEEAYCERVGIKGDGLRTNANVTDRVVQGVGNGSSPQAQTNQAVYAPPTIEYPADEN